MDNSEKKFWEKSFQNLEKKVDKTNSLISELIKLQGETLKKISSLVRLSLIKQEKERFDDVPSFKVVSLEESDIDK